MPLWDFRSRNMAVMMSLVSLPLVFSHQTPSKMALLPLLNESGNLQDQNVTQKQWIFDGQTLGHEGLHYKVMNVLAKRQERPIPMEFEDGHHCIRRHERVQALAHRQRLADRQLLMPILTAFR